MPEETIPWYRPVKYLRAFLSMSIWVPFANITYSFYLFHGFVVLTGGDAAKTIVADGRETDIDSSVCEFSPAETKKMHLITFGLTLSITSVISIFIFMLVEKQGINARTAFKNKF